MSTSVTPSVVTNGLTFAIDTANVKSFQGPPIVNLFPGVYSGGGITTGFSSGAGTEVVNIPGLGNTLTTYNLIQNNYTVYTPNSTNCCPEPIQYGGVASIAASTLYTYAIVYKCDSGYTCPNYMYRYEYNGGAYVGEWGIHSNSNRVHLGNGWYWAWATFTTQPTTTQLSNCASFYYQYSSFNDKLSVAKILLTPGDYTQLHPKYWPAAGTTRSTTASITDLTGTVALTASSLASAYTNGTVGFTGSNYIECATQNLLNSTGPFTIEAFYNNTNVTGNGVIIGNYGSGYAANSVWFFTGGLYLNSNLYIANYATRTQGKHHICATRDTAGNINVYFDGVLEVTGSNTAALSNNINWRIGADVVSGGEAFIGNIYSIKTYSRALSTAEVAQNFNALRGRYSI